MRFILGVIIGAAVGVALGLIVAPQSGKETRDALSRRIRPVADETGEEIDEIKETVTAG
jgi:gas vesicle protein